MYPGHRSIGALLAVAALAFALALLPPGNTHSAPADPAAGVPQNARYLVVHLFFGSTAERDRLALAWDAAEASTTDGYLTVWTDRAGYQSMLAQGLRAEIDEAETLAANQPIQWKKDSFYGGYSTVEEVYAFLDQQVAAHPGLAQKVDIGDSWCKLHAPCHVSGVPDWNGFDLFAMRISNQAIAGPKPVFWFESDIHAREILPPEEAMLYIRYLLDNYESNADAHWLVDYHDIYVMPVFNPDGHHLVEAGGDSPYLQRKNANYDECTTWLQIGIDLNRNFPYEWNCCGGSSGSPCAETYHGTLKGSEPETQAVMARLRALIPDQRGPDLGDAAPLTATGVVQDMHTYGAQNLISWSFPGTPAGNDADLRNIAQHMSAFDAGGNLYDACRPSECLYTMDGTAFDWAYGELGAASFSSESESSGVFFPPYSQVATAFAHNRGMLLYLAKIARTPYLLTRGPDANLAAASPMTVTQGTLVHVTTTINYAWALNTYSQTVAAAEFYVDTPPWAGGTPVAMSAVDGGFDSPVEAVQADLNTASLAYGRHIVFVRGRGVNDYEGHHSWGPVSAVFLWVASTPPPTPTSTPTPTATPCYGPDPFYNGSFEAGLDAWVLDSSSPAPAVSDFVAHAGAHAVQVGAMSGHEPYGDSSLYQEINVPASGGTLHFWYWPATLDRITYDWQDAYVLDRYGNTLATIMHEANDARRWTEMSFDMTPYAGQTVRVKFLVHEDGASDITAMYVDDVRLFTPCGSPTFTPTPTSTPPGYGRLYLPVTLYNP